jgi:hypothetical protein
MIRILQNELTGTYKPLGERLSAFDQEASALGRLPKDTGPESLRIIMPRALVFLYTLRNKRGIGHEGGDVDANEIDAAVCVRTADWCLSELIRVVHTLSLEEAQALLDAIAERNVPQVWAIAGVKRVLDPTLKTREQVLVLLYSDPDTAVPFEDLFTWVEYGRKDKFQERVLTPLHRERRFWAASSGGTRSFPTGDVLRAWHAREPPRISPGRSGSSLVSIRRSRTLRRS